MVTGHNEADIVVILKSLPTKQACEALSKKVQDDLKTVMKNEIVTKADVLKTELHDKGFNVCNRHARVKVLITTLPRNIPKLEADTHLNSEIMQSHLAAIRHSVWFEENVHHSSIKILIRLLKDLCKRFEAFQPLSPWILDLLAHFVTTNTPSRQALPINLAFRYYFYLTYADQIKSSYPIFTDGCCNSLPLVYFCPDRLASPIHAKMVIIGFKLRCRLNNSMTAVCLHRHY